VAAGWFGELYRASSEGLLGPELSALEAAVMAGLLGLPPGARVLDVACGTGRHLGPLSARGLRVFGLDQSGPCLAEAGLPGRLVRGDQRRLPFGAAFDGACSWYSSLFLYRDDENQRVLCQLSRVLRPGGRLLVQHANPCRLEREPAARAFRALPGGGEVEELSRYDPAAGVETLQRTMRRQGRVLAGEVRLRYYRPTEWKTLAAGAGLTLRALGSTGPGVAAPFSEEALDLIAVLEKPT